MLTQRRALVLILALMLVCLQWRLWFGDGGVAVNHRLQQAVADAESENAESAKQNAAIQADVDDLRRGGESIEARARSELGMIRRGETFYLVVRRN